MSIISKLVGNTGEKYAENYLKKNGYKILERNKRLKFVEIDIIASKNNTLYIFEVKSVSYETSSKNVSHETKGNTFIKEKEKDIEKPLYFKKDKLWKMGAFGEYYANKSGKFECVRIGIIRVKLVGNKKDPIINVIFD